MSIEKLSVDIGADTSGLQSGFKLVNSTLLSIKDAISGLNSTVSAMSAAMQSGFSAATAAANVTRGSVSATSSAMEDLTKNATAAGAATSSIRVPDVAPTVPTSPVSPSASTPTGTDAGNSFLPVVYNAQAASAAVSALSGAFSQTGAAATTAGTTASSALSAVVGGASSAANSAATAASGMGGVASGASAAAAAAAGASYPVSALGDSFQDMSLSASTAANAVVDVNFEEVGDFAATAAPKVDDAAKATDKASKKATAAGKSCRSLSGGLGAAAAGFRKANGALNPFKKGVSNLNNKCKSLMRTLASVVGIGAGIAGISQLEKSYLSLESSVIRVNDLFGDSAKYIDYFAKNTAHSFGMSENAASQYAATYGNLFRGITKDTAENAKVTIAMLKASAVIASKTGRTQEDVMERIRSGLMGNTEAIEDLGIYAQVAMINTTNAFKKIANGRSWEKLSYYEQQQIRTLSILEQASSQFGTSVQQGSAYSLSVLSGEFKNLQATAGAFVNNALQPAIAGLTQLTRQANAALKAVAAMMGIEISPMASASSAIASGASSSDSLAGNMADTAQSAKEIKKSLAGFDQLNVLPSDDTSISGTGGTSGAGGKSVFDDIPEPEYGETPQFKLPDWVGQAKAAAEQSDWAGLGTILAQRANAAIAASDWSGSGRSVAGKINAVFGTSEAFLDAFDFSGLGNGLVSSFNSVVQDTDWSSVGGTLGAAIAGAVDIAYAIATNTDWSGTGEAVADSLNAAVKKVDFGKVAKTVVYGSKGIWTCIASFFDNLDGEEIGAAIVNYFDNMDYGSIAFSVWKGVWSILKFVGRMLWGALKESVNNKLKGTTILGAKLCVAFKNGFSPSSVSEHFNLVVGKITRELGRITPIAAEKFSSAWSKAKEVFSIGNAKQHFGDLADGISGKFDAVKSAAAEKFSSAWSKAKEVFSVDSTKRHFGDIADGIKSKFSTIPDWFEEKFVGIASKIAGAFDGVANLLKTPINEIIGIMNSALGCFESMANYVIDCLNKISVENPITGTRYGFDIEPVDIETIPPLANGGLATAPTLAMVGDNRNAKVDPEVIAPLSKLQGMMGGSSEETTRLLRSILARLEKMDPSPTVVLDGREVGKASAKYNHGINTRTGRVMV